MAAVSIAACSASDRPPDAGTRSLKAAADCGYSGPQIESGQPRRKFRRELQVLAQRQPNALAVNSAGQSSCAYVHTVCSPEELAESGCPSLLYLSGSRRPLSIDGDGRVELHFESPVTEVEPVFPEETCGRPQRLNRIDESAWEFELSPEILSGACDSVAEYEDPPIFTFAFDADYERGGRFSDYSVSYGLTVELDELEPDEGA